MRSRFREDNRTDAQLGSGPLGPGPRLAGRRKDRRSRPRIPTARSLNATVQTAAKEWVRETEPSAGPGTGAVVSGDTPTED